MSIQETTWKFLKGKGLPEKSVAAVMGNIQGECDFDSNQIEAGSGNGFGLIQWSFERRTQLEAYGTDLTHQLNFLWAELSGDTGSTGAYLQWTDKSGYLSHDKFMSGNGSIADLTAAMCFCFERPGVPRLSVRQDAAQKYFSQFTGTAGDASSSDGNSQQTITIPTTNYQVVKGSQKEGEILYGRRYRITVSDNKGNGFDVSQLRCTFNIVKTILMEPNLSQIIIYNLNAQTENSIEMYGTRVTVEAGYEGNQYGTIFDGDILQTIRDKEDGATYRLTIVALDGDKSVNFDIANYSVLRGQTARTIVEHIVNKAQYPVSLGSISKVLNNTPALTRGKVFFGKSSDYLNQIAESNKCKSYTEDGKVNIIKLDEMPKDEIIDLTPKNGLIGTPEQSDYGVNGQCLLNPKIKVNSLIHIDNSLVRAKKISITGNNSVPASSSGTNSTRQKIIDKAKELCKMCADGKAIYCYGGGGATINGILQIDCSYFVKLCYEAAGMTMEPPSGSQFQTCSQNGGFIGQVSDIKSKGLAGDILFKPADGSEHVGIYDGNGGYYAAHGIQNYAPNKSISHKDSIQYEGFVTFGRPKELVNADSGNPPSASSSTSTGTDSTVGSNTQTPVFRSLDKDGIYRVIKVTYEGDTRGDNWYADFETIDQVGGVIPITAI